MSLRPSRGTARGEDALFRSIARPRAWREQLDELVATVAIEEEARALLERTTSRR